jgi:predicted nucleic acid-binding protein
LLQDDQVLCHPFVIGELACGNLHNRNEILHLLEALPRTPVADHSEVLHLINAHRLYGQGLGWIDAHLLASALIAGCELWTSDRLLHTLVDRVGL